MKLILIYGSPAVGKFTTAAEIAKLTDFRVFHNHLRNCAVLEIGASFPASKPSPKLRETGRI